MRAVSLTGGRLAEVMERMDERQGDDGELRDKVESLRESIELERRI